MRNSTAVFIINLFITPTGQRSNRFVSDCKDCVTDCNESNSGSLSWSLLIIRKHDMKFHLHADDTQLYLMFDTNNRDSEQSALSKMETCISETKTWMLSNKLYLNGGKIAFLQFYPHQSNILDVFTILNIGNDSMAATLNTKHLDVLLDNDLTLSPHITSICKTANFHLYMLTRIRKYLNPEALKIAVHSLIPSKMDYCNSPPNCWPPQNAYQ